MKTKYKIIVATFLIGLFIVIILFIFFKDNKTHILKRYYPESKEIYESEYIIRNEDTVFQGKTIIYSSKGIKIAECNFINDTLNGKYISYYDTGKIKYMKYMLNDKRKAEILWNYPNGQTEKYALFSTFKEPIFIINFDNKGPIYYEGHVLENIYFGKFNTKKKSNSCENKCYKVGDTLIHQYLVANIPDAKRSFKIESSDINNLKIKRTITQKLPTTIEVKEVLTTKGKNTIKAVVKYEFMDNIMPPIINTLSFDINVN